MTEPADQFLFTYGTLQYPGVQLDTFGRLLDSEPDTLERYTIDYVEITDPRVVELSGEAVHPIVRATGDPRDKVTGVVLRVSEAELVAADEYEVSLYRRAAITLASGREAWIYLPATAPGILPS
ncbi:gamma-glutamylcyclotransferase family protein [Microbacterium sp. X-17]|uniref:gamma-glutamylcyclotransferase family protein n=1 Tax=Microbacterium sp. X-17 TaxID=3144404 RepID=UPI0031F50E79